MVVCHCLAINDRTILAQIAEGAVDLDDLAASCGAGAHCGGCHPTIEALLARSTTDTVVALRVEQTAA